MKNVQTLFQEIRKAWRELKVANRAYNDVLFGRKPLPFGTTLAQLSEAADQCALVLFNANLAYAKALAEGKRTIV